MALFDFLNDSELRGKFETNHFHMIVEDDIGTADISSLPAKVKGTFMHEYIHYIQFINTVFGISYGLIHNNYFSLCREYFLNNDTIDIPLSVLQENPIVKNYIEKYKSLKGSTSNLDISIDKIIIEQEEIERAQKNKSVVLLKAIDYETHEERTFCFGYLCIVESMAFYIQQLFDPEIIEHSDIPYNAVQLVCRSAFPEIAADQRMLIAICLCSLNYENPSVGFFEVLEILRQNPRLNGKTLYKHMLETSIVIYKGEKKLIREVFIKFIDDYQINIKSAIQCDLEYFSKVFENCKYEINQGESLLLNLLYDSDITSKDSIEFLLNHYGLPFVESQTSTLMAKLPGEDSDYMDIACLRGFEMVINRFLPEIDKGIYPIYDPKCPMYAKCLGTQYLEEGTIADMSIECKNKQWLKQETCLMTIALKKYHVFGKEIIQKSLPLEM